MSPPRQQGSPENFGNQSEYIILGKVIKRYHTQHIDYHQDHDDWNNHRRLKGYGRCGHYKYTQLTPANYELHISTHLMSLTTTMF